MYLLLQDYGTCKTVLMWASSGGHIKIVEALLQGDADTDYQDVGSSTKAVRYMLCINKKLAQYIMLLLY